MIEKNTVPSMSRKSLLFAALLLTVGSTVNAAIVTFTGADSGAGFGVAHPGSDAAQASFATAAGALGSLRLIDFEAAALGNITNGVAFSLGSGVTVTLNGTDLAFGQGITNDNTDSTLGFNITSGGTQFLRTVPTVATGNATVVFDFTGGVSAFGTYLTGLESTVGGTFSVTFNDGSSQNFALSKNAVAGAQFYGLTDAGKTIASVTINEVGPFSNSRDVRGLDNLQFVSASAVPEPGTSSLLLLGIPAFAFLARRRIRIGK